MIKTLRWGLVVSALSMVVVWAGTADAEFKKCRRDQVKAGCTCIDRYEASVWQIPATSPSGKSNKSLIKRVREGKATTAASGPGALIRGSFFRTLGFAGPLTVDGRFEPSSAANHIGFRCARPSF